MKPTIKISILIVLLLIVSWLSYDMINLYFEQKLWGRRPLFLFIGIWAAFILLVEKRMTKTTSKSWRWLGFSTLSGLLLALGFPTFPLTFLMFIAFVPLLKVEKEIAEQSTSSNKWEVFKYSYHTFVVWNILTTFWVANTAFLASIVAIWLNAFFMSIPFVLFHQTKKAIPRLAYAAFIIYWLSFEYVHLNWEISWTWLTLGNAFATFPSWVQWYEFTGVFGGSLWILLANTLSLIIIEQYINAKPKQLTLSILKLAALILIPLLASLIMYYNYQDQGTSVEVVIVQPNYEPHYEKFTISQREQMQHFLKLSAEKLDENTDYLLFPETCFGSINVNNWNSNAPIRDLKDFVLSYPNLKLITGISAYKIFKEGEQHSRAVRTLERRNQPTLYYEALNAATQIQNGQEDLPLYVKSKLVPGAEFLPYREIFFFLEPLVKSLDGSMAGHGIRPERSVFQGQKGNIAPAICYESVYGEYTTEYIRKGANAIFIMTNDGWWDNTAGHRQHLAFASLRAIETRKSIARSTNTGVSAFLNQRGDILQPTKYDEAIAIKGSILLNNHITFYVRWGDMIARVAAFIAILLLLNTFVKMRMKT